MFFVSSGGMLPFRRNPSCLPRLGNKLHHLLTSFFHSGSNWGSSYSSGFRASGKSGSGGGGVMIWLVPVFEVLNLKIVYDQHLLH
jgi:hypothetical protein